jgi:glyoxylase-like metal-dependent hydrolase (beta-lactamase superfamily II)
MAEMQRYGNNCNSYIIASALPQNKHVIIDPGQVVNEAGQLCMDKLVDEMKKDGIRVEDIGLIINTHAHPDHYGASQTIKKRSNALVTISERDDRFIREMKEQFSKQIEMMGIGIPEVGADFYLWEGQVNLGKGLKLEILHTPGHSPGHVSIYWPAMKVLIGGDLIFYGSTGRVDLPGGNARLLKESIERVSHLGIDYLLTGHQYGSPGIIQGEENIKRNFDFVRKDVFPYL